MAAAAALSLCSSLTRKLSCRRPLTPSIPAPSGNNLLLVSDSPFSLTLTLRSKPAINFVAKLANDGDLNVNDTDEAVVPETDDTAEAVVDETDTDGEFAEVEYPRAETDPSVESAEPKREEVFAVVMVGSRQYMVFPGRYIYTQKLKGANVNDKITLNKVLLVGTRTSTYIGKPIVPNATVLATVEEQTLDKKVIVFKYKKKKHYRRNIGHRQPITRIRITSISGYQDSPAVTIS